MNDAERLRRVMEYSPVDRVPNYELGLWWQTAQKWRSKGMELPCDFRCGISSFGIDRRDFIDVHYGMCPPFEREIMEKGEGFLLLRDVDGIVKKVHSNHQGRCPEYGMDEFISYPVSSQEDFKKITRRYIADDPARYKEGWDQKLSGEYPIFLGYQKPIYGFYSFAREWMGIEQVAYGWYENPSLMQEMMEFIAHFIMEASKKAMDELKRIDCVIIHDDYGAKGGPMISPDIFRSFIFPHLRKTVDFFKTKAKYVGISFNGNAQVLLPQLLDAGITFIQAVECASGMDPVLLRKEYGKQLRMLGGVDKRVLIDGNIQQHMKQLYSLIEEGGFIPMIDHAISPDISYENFLHYLKIKSSMLHRQNFSA